MNGLNSKTETKNKSRFILIYVVIGLVFFFYIYRLFDYQILNGAGYLAQAEDNRTEQLSIQSQRGIIYDRNGTVLARNVPSYNVVVIPANLPDDPGEIQRLFIELSETIDMPVSNGTLDEATVKAFTPCYGDLGIQEVVYIAETNWPFQATGLKCNIDKQTAMIISEKATDWPGIDIEIESIREYPTGNLTAEIIGFNGPIPAGLEEYYTGLGFVSGRDKVGYAGIESTMQDLLGGENGLREVEVTVGGEIVRNVSEPIDPIPGQDVTLTLDVRLQAVARSALIRNLDYWNNFAGRILSTSGVVIALDPQTGEILAMVSYPNFENNRMSRFIPGYYYEQLIEDQSRPLVNHAISDELPPGSVFKLASALGVLNEGVVTPDYEIEDPGIITLMQKILENDEGVPLNYYCWNRSGHGMVDYLHGIAWSCNTYWYKVTGGYEDEVEGYGLGIWRLAEYAKALGYGALTNIELPGETDGLIPDPTWKRLTQGENWATGDTYLAAVGQGYVLATPIQVVNSIATIANGGKRMQVSIIKEVTNSEGQITQSFSPNVLWDITKDPVITVYDENSYATDQKITVQPWVIEMAKQGMRMVTLEGGTAALEFAGDTTLSAGKTGTAEYCDDNAQSQGLCDERGAWPAHAWYVGYAPYDNPEIIAVAFVYNGKEGSSFAAPIVRSVIEAYFELKAADAGETP